MDLVTDAEGQLASYFGRFAPELVDSDYGKEIWRLFEAGNLAVDSELRGRIEVEHRIADVDAVLEEVKLALQAEERRLLCQAG